MIFITGGCGFIGSNFIHYYLKNHTSDILNIDALTYSGHLENTALAAKNPRYHFAHLNILEQDAILELMQKHRPTALIHFAAESHVDRSIENPEIFLETNVLGTQRLLQASLNYYKGLSAIEQQNFRFVHVSTDEVYGSLNLDDAGFDENTNYAPNSPYSASKAASDHFVRSYFHTFKLPTLITNCSNNYGPYQYPEKLIPLMIQQAMQKKPLPIYGNGKNIRDWLYVDDHCSAIVAVLQRGKAGEKYNIGGNQEKTNLDVVHTICEILDKLQPREDGASYSQQITFVQDRAGHDFRYAINSAKIQNELKWQAKETFYSGIMKTIDWYLNNPDWLNSLKNK